MCEDCISRMRRVRVSISFSLKPNLHKLVHNVTPGCTAEHINYEDTLSLTFDTHPDIAALLKPTGRAFLSAGEKNFAIAVTSTFKIFLILHCALEEALARLARLHTIMEAWKTQNSMEDTTPRKATQISRRCLVMVTGDLALHAWNCLLYTYSYPTEYYLFQISSSNCRYYF